MGKDFLTVAQTSDLPEGGALTVRIAGQELALFNVAGEICALDDRCPHRGGSLGAGTMENGSVFCPLHGWQFDVKTGACLDKPDRPARSFRVRVVNGQIQVELGE